MQDYKYVYRYLNKSDINQGLIGRKVYVRWPDDGTWYRGVVKRCSPSVLTIYYTETREEERAAVDELLEGNEIAFKEKRATDHECVENEAEAGPTEFSDDERESLVDSDEDTIPDAGELEEPDSDVSFSSGDDAVHKEKRPKYSPEAPAQAGSVPRNNRKPTLKSSPPKQAEVELRVRQKAQSSFSDALKVAARDAGQNMELSNDLVTAIGQEIEQALFEVYGPAPKEYKKKAMSLHFNMRDAHNPELRAHVLQKEISPNTLVRMSASELASKELVAYRKHKEEEALKMSVIDAEAAAKFSTAAALEARDRQIPPTLTEQDMHHDAKKQTGVLPQALAKPLGGSGILDKDEGGRPEEWSPVGDNNTAQRQVDWANLKAQTSTVVQHTDVEGSSSFALNLPNALVGLDSIRQSTGGPEFSWLFQQQSNAGPSKWPAQITVPGSGSFEMQGQSLTGPESIWKVLGSSQISVQGRLAVAKLEAFLHDLQLSKSRTASVAILQQAQPDEEENRREFDLLASHYKEKQRAGVAHIEGLELYLLANSELASKLLTANSTAKSCLNSNEMLAVVVYRHNWQPLEEAVAQMPALPAGLDLSAIDALAKHLLQ